MSTGSLSCCCWDCYCCFCCDILHPKVRLKRYKTIGFALFRISSCRKWKQQSWNYSVWIYTRHQNQWMVLLRCMWSSIIISFQSNSCFKSSSSGVNCFSFFIVLASNSSMTGSGSVCSSCSSFLLAITVGAVADKAGMIKTALLETQSLDFLLVPFLQKSTRALCNPSWLCASVRGWPSGALQIAGYDW